MGAQLSRQHAAFLLCTHALRLPDCRDGCTLDAYAGKVPESRSQRRLGISEDAVSQTLSGVSLAFRFRSPMASHDFKRSSVCLTHTTTALVSPIIQCEHSGSSGSRDAKPPWPLLRSRTNCVSNRRKGISKWGSYTASRFQSGGTGLMLLSCSNGQRKEPSRWCYKRCQLPDAQTCFVCPGLSEGVFAYKVVHLRTGQEPRIPQGVTCD